MREKCSGLLSIALEARHRKPLTLTVIIHSSVSIGHVCERLYRPIDHGAPTGQPAGKRASLMGIDPFDKSIDNTFHSIQLALLYNVGTSKPCPKPDPQDYAPNGEVYCSRYRFLPSPRRRFRYV